MYFLKRIIFNRLLVIAACFNLILTTSQSWAQNQAQENQIPPNLVYNSKVDPFKLSPGFSPVVFSADSSDYGKNLLEIVFPGMLQEWSNSGINTQIGVAQILLFAKNPQPQFAITINNNLMCSPNGCFIIVFDYENGQWQPVLQTVSKTLAVQDQTENLVKNLETNFENKWQWNGKDFELIKRKN